MKQFLFALAVGFLFAATSTAQAPATTTTTADPPVITTAPATPGIVIGSSVPTPTVMTPSAPVRRGLFGRLRNRGTTSVMTSPASYPTSGAIINVPATTVPTPMPSITPAPRPGGTSSTLPGVIGAPVMVAGGALPNGAVIPAGGVVVNGTVVPAGAMMAADSTMMASTTTTTSTRRMGLFARLRARR